MVFSPGTSLRAAQCAASAKVTRGGPIPSHSTSCFYRHHIFTLGSFYFIDEESHPTLCLQPVTANYGGAGRNQLPLSVLTEAAGEDQKCCI